MPAPRVPSAGVSVDKIAVNDAANLLADGPVAVLVGAVRPGLAPVVYTLADQLRAQVFVLPEGYRFFGEDASYCGERAGKATRVVSGAEPATAEALKVAGRVLLIGPRSAAVQRLVGGRDVVQIAGSAELGDRHQPGWTRLLGEQEATLTQLSALVPEGSGEPPATGAVAATDQAFWSSLDTALPADAVLALEPGRVMDGAFDGLPVRRRTWSSSFGLGVPGYALPAAIGAVFACPGREVVAVTTDTGLADGLGQPVLMSALFIAMLNARRSSAGQSTGIAVAKLLGTLCAGGGAYLYPATEELGRAVLVPYLTAVVLLLDLV
jgi:thiamine pyrophosphate-dependent acetolactate synthase large subunit-like protein